MVHSDFGRPDATKTAPEKLASSVLFINIGKKIYVVFLNQEV